MTSDQIIKKEILIVHTWGLGDLILLTPVLKIVHTLNTDVSFSFLIFQKAASSPIMNAPYVNEIKYAKWNLGTLLRSIVDIRKKKYYAALFSSGVTPWKAGLFLLFIKSQQKIGEYCRYRFPFLNKYSLFQQEKSRTENNYNLFNTIFQLPGLYEVLINKEKWQFKTEFYLTGANQIFADNFLSKHTLQQQFIIGIHPGCMAKNKYRRWPLEYFIELVDLLRKHFSCALVIIAGPDELEEAEFISSSTSSILLSNESLDNVAAIISKCSFFINTDSGLGHVASCFNLKSVTIFGPGDERQTAPFSENNFVIRNHIACAPCVRKKQRNCDVECLKLLKPKVVFDKVVEIIG